MTKYIKRHKRAEGKWVYSILLVFVLGVTAFFFIRKDYLLSPYIESKQSSPEIVMSLGVISDSHGANGNIAQALKEMVELDVDMVVHLGDFTAGGEDESFKGAHEKLKESGIPYVVMPGDHDFNWLPEHSRSNYEYYFGKAYNQTREIGNIAFIFYENSVDESSDESILWLRDGLNSTKNAKIRIFFSPKPLFNPYFASKVDDEGDRVIEILKEHEVRYAVAGDTHIFSKYYDTALTAQESTNTESSSTDYEMTFVTVGAVGEYKSPLPQWVYLQVSSDGSVTFEPKPLVNF